MLVRVTVFEATGPSVREPKSTLVSLMDRAGAAIAEVTKSNPDAILGQMKEGITPWIPKQQTGGEES